RTDAVPDRGGAAEEARGAGRLRRRGLERCGLCAARQSRARLLPGPPGPVSAGGAGRMRHARPEDLDRVDPLIARVREAGSALTEKKRGVFYLKSRAFLHFHEDPK